MFSNRRHLPPSALLLLLLLLQASPARIVSFSDTPKSNLKCASIVFCFRFPVNQIQNNKHHTQSSSKLHHKHIQRLRGPLETRSVHGGVHPVRVVSEGAVAESSQEYFDALAAALL
jgi:hypothetical protein